MSQLQRIVDSLANVLGRPVAVHDMKRRILAYSSHDGPVDDVRATSILTRRTVDAASGLSDSIDLEAAEGPVRVPANPEVGMLARICTPVRFDGRVLALMWLVDSEESLPESSFEIIGSAADNAAIALHRDEFAQRARRGREQELLRLLLEDEPELSGHAAYELIDHNVLAATDGYTALVVRPVDRAGRPAQPEDETVRADIERIVEQVRTGLPPMSAVHVQRQDHGLLLLATDDAGGAEPVARGLLTVGERTFEGDETWRVIVGVGSRREALAQARFSATQAVRAAQLGAAVSDFGPIVDWQDIGVYQLLVELPQTQLQRFEIHRGVHRLLQSKDAPIWVRTLEVYLDSGGDAPAAAQELNIQRGSCYYRLRRIEELAAVDLQDGQERLLLHLGLKIARLRGQIPDPGA